MNAKTLRILVIATLVCVAAAFAFQKLGAPGSGQADLPDRVAPGLAARLNEVAAIEITGAEGALRLARAGEEWTVASKDGYPAKFEIVKQLLVALAELAPRERKTTDPERYTRLGLADPGASSESLGVTLAAADGSEIAGFILGEQVDAGGKPQRFVRTAGDPQSWLAEGKIDAPTDAMRWLDAAITQIARDRVTRVTITHPDAEVVSLAREQGGTNYTLETVPEGRTPKPAGEVGAPASALAYLRFDDVCAGGGTDGQAGDPVVAVYETADGLRVTVRTWEVEGKWWATFDAEAIAEPTAPAGESPEDEAPSADPAADPQAEADTLNAKLSGWLFSIPEYQAKSFRKRLADLTEEPQPTEDAAEGDLLAPPPDRPASVPSLDAVDPPKGGG